MQGIQHDFTDKITEILEFHHGEQGARLLGTSTLLQYLNYKTKAANRGSKSRAGLGNHYAIYVLVEDYINNAFHTESGYAHYAGAQFSKLLARQRQLPFGSKLQNHALNHRLNQEFLKLFPTTEHIVPIIRDVATNRYWINENLLQVSCNGSLVNIAEAVKAIIEAYIAARQQAFNEFMTYCQQMMCIQEENRSQATAFVKGLLSPNVDARVFEIVSYAILKEHYADQLIYWGWSPNDLNTDYLSIYKTGRTNANDGGIDFVMKPLGRFFQVTETVDAGKYFLDIDKVQRYPITFVVKSGDTVEAILNHVKTQAHTQYAVEAIVKRYMECVEEVINVPRLAALYESLLQAGRGDRVIEEIVLQSRVEFNVESEEPADLEIDEGQPDEDDQITLFD